MKNIVYSRHLELRLKLRAMPYELPRIIYQESQERYLDTATGLYVAVGVANYQGKIREIAVTFIDNIHDVRLITVHPLKLNQKLHRVISSRWRKI